MRLLLIHAVYLRHTLGAKKESKHSNTLSENPVLCDRCHPFELLEDNYYAESQDFKKPVSENLS